MYSSGLSLPQSRAASKLTHTWSNVAKMHAVAKEVPAIGGLRP